MALLLLADEELRRRRQVAKAVETMPASHAPVAPPAAVASTAPAVAMAVSRALQRGRPAAAPEPKAVAVGRLAGDPLGPVLPGVTSARVGLLAGLRTQDMLKYNGVRGGLVRSTTIYRTERRPFDQLS